MKTKMKTISIALAAAFMLSGCSMWGNEDEASKGATNATNEKTPTNPETPAVEDSMDNMMNYLNEQGVEISNMKAIDQMDFAAHEGNSFSYNGNTAYLYRLKSNDESMSALLKDAKEKGTVKVNMGGTEQEYNASVNGDYLFVYGKDMDMSSMIEPFNQYVPGATTTTPNTGGADNTMPTNGKEEPVKEPADQLT